MLVPVLQKDGTIVLKNPEYDDVTNYLDTITKANKNDDLGTDENTESDRLIIEEHKETIKKVTKK